MARAAPTGSRPCKACGRPLPATAEPDRVYCSKACARRRVAPADRRLETAVLELLGRRAPGATICPSEVARQGGGDVWRELMEPVRRAARRLAARKEVEVTQGGRVVDPGTVRGPIRLRLLR